LLSVEIGWDVAFKRVQRHQAKDRFVGVEVGGALQRGPKLVREGEDYNSDPQSGLKMELDTGLLLIRNCCVIHRSVRLLSAICGSL
jgi:hypothetical protein